MVRGICGELFFFSNFSILSIIDPEGFSFLWMIVSEMLVIIKKTAITEVNFVKKSAADWDDIKLSFPAPIPNAPPSDLCKRTDPIRSAATITCIIKMIFSIEG